jgi:hypothetical protein
MINLFPHMPLEEKHENSGAQHLRPDVLNRSRSEWEVATVVSSLLYVRQPKLSIDLTLTHRELLCFINSLKVGTR